MDSFAIFKATEKKNEKSPDYNISMKIGEKYENIGGCWIKDGAKGKFFSCQLSKSYKDRAGYHIEIDIPKAEPKPIKAENTIEYPKDDINADNIPF